MKSSKKALPQLQLHAHHRGQPLHLPLWRKTATAALPLCLAELKFPEAPLASLEEIEVSLISDPAIADIHAQFLDDPTPTDVITFHHGEILISLDTAARQGLENAHPYEREVALYLIHGLLHLAGWNDVDPLERDLMHQRQNRILDAVWPI